MRVLSWLVTIFFLVLAMSPAHAACRIFTWTSPRLARAVCDDREPMSTVLAFGREQCSGKSECTIHFWDDPALVPVLTPLMESITVEKPRWNCAVWVYQAIGDQLKQHLASCSLRK